MLSNKYLFECFECTVSSEHEPRVTIRTQRHAEYIQPLCYSVQDAPCLPDHFLDCIFVFFIYISAARNPLILQQDITFTISIGKAR